ncbi:hypothetical protein C0991_009006 [Blastosporella zonata]|nr:hypothetical protein C0991_009006 [Blastosporella zonata]
MAGFVAHAYSSLYADDFQDYDYDYEYPMSSMQPPPPPSPNNNNIPIDPALALYPPYYPSYHHHHQQQPQQQHIPHHLALPNYSSPSSAGSDTLGTPPTEHMYISSTFNPAGKRPASAISNDPIGRKKSRKEDESSMSMSMSPAADKEEVKAKPTRGSRACTVCRRLKMKCVGAEQGGPCKRCMSGNHECIFEESNRGKRSSKKHELLTRSLRKMEKTLDTVLRSIGNPGIASGMVSRSPSPGAVAAGTQALIAAEDDEDEGDQSFSQPSQHQGNSQQHPHPHPHPHPPGSPKLHSLPDNALNPLGLLAEASLANRKVHNPNASPMMAIVRGTAAGADGDATGKPQMGVASDNYFKPGPMTILPLRRLYIERQIQPEMLSFVSKEEVVELFNIFFDHIAQGYKSLEIVQAYLLLSLWGCGAVERYEQDKTWMLLGMGIRMATDLNLHRKTTVSSLDTQEGRARDLEELQRVLSRCLEFLYAGTDTPSGLQVHCDYMLVIKSFEAQLLTWKDHWVIHRDFTADSPQAIDYKKLIAHFYFNYAVLVLNSFGLQNALERSPVDLGHFFAQCHSAATTCATLVRDELGPRGFMKYAPDSHCVMISYAVLSLLKLIRPEFHPYLDDEQRTLSLVSDVADTLEGCAANALHTPALYSHFLRALIAAKTDSTRYNSMDGLSGGFLFGAGGSGLITPRFGMSPVQSGANTPARTPAHALTQHSINAAFGQAAKVEV